MPTIRTGRGELLPFGYTWVTDRALLESQYLPAVRYLVDFYGYDVEDVQIHALTYGRDLNDVSHYTIRVTIATTPRVKAPSDNARYGTHDINQRARAFVRTFPAGDDLLVEGIRLWDRRTANGIVPAEHPRDEMSTCVDLTPIKRKVQS